MKPTSLRTLIGIISALSGWFAASSAFAQVSNVENVALWRIQIETHTCDSSDAGTDSNVWIQFRDPNPGFAAPKHYLANPGNDRRRAHWDLYDVPPAMVALTHVSDIQYLRLGIDGTDKWCFDAVNLYLNGNVNGVGGNYPMTISFASSGTFNIGTGGVQQKTFTYTELRTATWNALALRNVIAVPPALIPRANVEDMIQGIFGDSVVQNRDWGGLNGSRYVDLTTTHASGLSSTARVDLDLERGSGINVDVDFTVYWACTGGPGNVNFNSYYFDITDSDNSNLTKGWIQTIGNAIVTFDAGDVGRAFREALPTSSCPNTGFTTNGDLSIGF